ncbi:MAG: hypothetical protein FWE67_07980 [Planctomycetaceae bacterium]|nr:hypothetical protein [Planctomycetaceae bacterium]
MHSAAAAALPPRHLQSRFNPSFFNIVLGVQRTVWARRPRKAREQTEWKGWRTP